VRDLEGEFGGGKCQGFLDSLMYLRPVIYYKLLICYLKVKVRTDIVVAFMFIN